ncbi:TetR family transcriptional regulator [Streptomyces lydicamycinicus]|uniref:Putative TetR family transcriptional regulator n=1 Tax=Streptomyces lydicamycinicus TaxID=1546107 RepID=A0A0P4R4K5_9ACTN|nr:TetR/AcrR family transcriptional regulator [Streptomyces lydicamycinicus]USA04418.1 TetR family transcriptional regulator [Streptomyces lydicamycinicus]GAO07676.1 putative TetR family transcriptional regulator [Streptomyces lydicamycinicus]
MNARSDRTPAPAAVPRHELIADAALTLLAERGMRGLTHRAVDEEAGLPQGSTSNVARTRAALLEAAVRRLAEREMAVLTARERPAAARAEAGSGAEDTGAAVAEALSLALHRYLSRHRELLLARYELALEATRRPELRAVYDRAGRAFREPMAAMLAAAGSADPERHAMNMVAWCDGILFSCTAGQFHAAVPTRAALRTSCAELLDGMLRG